SVHLGHFYLRRALRLLPAMFALVLVCCLYTLVTENRARFATTLDDALSVIFYYLNWRYLAVGPDLNILLGHTWSLSVEEQFYTLWPSVLVVLLALRVRRRWVILLVLAGTAIPPCLRVARWEGPECSWLYFRTDMRGDALFWGCLVALAV